MMTSSSILVGSVRAADHERAIVRALASFLDDALVRDDLSTAADVARQLAEYLDGLREAGADTRGQTI